MTFSAPFQNCSAALLMAPSLTPTQWHSGGHTSLLAQREDVISSMTNLTSPQRFSSFVFFWSHNLLPDRLNQQAGALKKEQLQQ